MSRSLSSSFLAAFVTLAIAGSARADEPATEPPPELPAPTTAAPPSEAIPSAPPEDKPATPTPEKPPTPIGVRFDGGWSPHKLFDLAVSGADLGFAVGPRPQPTFAVWAMPRLFVGSTENGLGVWSGSLGVELEGILDRFRLGGGVGLFLLGVHRAVRKETLLSYGPDIHAAARFDVAQTDDFAIFLRAAFGGGYEFFGGSAFWGPTLGAGVELDVGVKRTPPPTSARPRPTWRTGSAAE